MNTLDIEFMKSALALARQGEGTVEPNPMVGCVLVRNGQIVGQGYHEIFGGPHAEVNALASCDNTIGSTAYVTLEPCCHHGKTGPCTQALIEAEVSRVVIAVEDPFAKVGGKGIKQLVAAGIEVEVGTGKTAATELIRPYLKKVKTGLPWVIAKWAMTLDGKIATTNGQSKWISGEESRAIAHQIRGRVDAIIAGIGTVLADDPLLTARPPGPRDAVRVIVDPKAEMPMDSQLVKTANETPVAIAIASDANPQRRQKLQDAGCQLIETDADNHTDRLTELLRALGNMNFTNVMIEGGSSIFGALNDGKLIDEVHAFIAPKIFGGTRSTSAVAGTGFEQISNCPQLRVIQSRQVGNDLYLIGRTDG